jgi:hypothetical protein
MINGKLMNRDDEAVRQAVLDYVEDVYETDMSKIDQQYHGDGITLTKRKFERFLAHKGRNVPLETTFVTQYHTLTIAEHEKCGRAKTIDRLILS